MISWRCPPFIHCSSLAAFVAVLGCREPAPDAPGARESMELRRAAVGGQHPRGPAEPAEPAPRVGEPPAGIDRAQPRTDATESSRALAQPQADATGPSGAPARSELEPRVDERGAQLPGAPSLAPLGEAQRQLLLAGATDAPIAVDTHYLHSNETRHELFFPYIADKGGAYVGVGSDQNYTLMATAKAEYALLLDIDRRVIDLHRMHEILIVAHSSPRALVDAWHRDQAEATRQLLVAGLADGDPADARRILRGFAAGRETVYRHLERVIGRTRAGRATSWLSDPGQYAYVRAMFQTGRVRAMSGDLAGTQSLKSVAAACTALGTSVRVLYMSNAEEYFKYTPAFVANIQGLPVDASDDAVVLRTIYGKEWVHADLWAYQVQDLADFRRRLTDRKNRSRNPMLRYARADGAVDKAGAEGLSTVGVKS